LALFVSLLPMLEADVKLTKRPSPEMATFPAPNGI
jgi:hypothetical protein